MTRSEPRRAINRPVGTQGGTPRIVLNAPDDEGAAPGTPGFTVPAPADSLSVDRGLSFIRLRRGQRHLFPDS
jgi:hypothetical protein